jgi:hypothetical protein
MIEDPFPGKGPLPPGDPNFYISDDLIERLRVSLESGDSVCLAGEYKAGKTSLLNQLLIRLSNDRILTALVDLQFVAPRKDKLVLAKLARSAARVIESKQQMEAPIEMQTFEASDDTCYGAFQTDLDRLRPYLISDQESYLVWLIDEFDILRAYNATILPVFLRPIVQSDPNFRMIAAGHDLFVLPHEEYEWAHFMTAFGAYDRVGELDTVSAIRLLNLGVESMDIALEMDRELIMNWTGRNPFYLKWVSSSTARAINELEYEPMLDLNLWRVVKDFFIAEPVIKHHFAHWWNQLSSNQHSVLSLMVGQASDLNNRASIVNSLREHELLSGNERAEQKLAQDLERLVRLGLLVQQDEDYYFTSGCLMDWIRVNKPLR